MKIRIGFQIVTLNTLLSSLTIHFHTAFSRITQDEYQKLLSQHDLRIIGKKSRIDLSHTSTTKFQYFLIKNEKICFDKAIEVVALIFIIIIFDNGHSDYNSSSDRIGTYTFSSHYRSTFSTSLYGKYIITFGSILFLSNKVLSMNVFQILYFYFANM